MSLSIFKFGSTTFDFEQMICISQGSFWRLKYNEREGALYRLSHKSFVRQSPTVEKAYLDYVVIEKILLGEDNE